MIHKILKEFGLNEKESEIYVILLKEKSATASKLAKITKINRTTTYLELENLTELGLVSYVIKNSKRYYQPAKPERFIEILNLKKEKFKSILPQLKNLHKTTTPFKIEVFEGKEGIKTFYQDILNNAKEILVFGATGKAIEVLKYSYPHFLKKFIQSNLKRREIANFQAKKIIESYSKTNLKLKYLPEKYSAEVTTVIYDNKIAIQSLQKDNIYVTVITDKLLYQSYKNYFEFMWKSI
jgi:sugar-specific transcriptional regulator TrmB